MTRFQTLMTGLFFAGVAGLAACGPGGSSRTVFFYIGEDGDDIESIEFEAVPLSGDFVGSDGGCEFSAAAGGAEAGDILEVTGAGSLRVKKQAAAFPLGAGSLVVTCQISDDNAEPEIEQPIDTLACRVTGENTNSDDPDADCPVVLEQETVPECGNGIEEGQEECDDGEENGNTKPCLTDCVLAECGDGKSCTDADCDTGPDDGPEDCDDGNTNDADSCKNDCSK